jgi:hypothetical protein
MYSEKCKYIGLSFDSGDRNDFEKNDKFNGRFPF